MKTKTILKTLAVALLMPAMLLTTACSNEDDLTNNTVNSQPVANKGYALPVTVNATRGGDATRATFDGSKLNFGTGDKLFVYGSATAAGSFAGELTWQSGGTFSGTIYTQEEWTGTPDALFTAASTGENLTATLLPNNYKSTGFLSINNNSTTDIAYDDRLTVSGSYAFVASETAKATGVEQLSLERASTYSSGFALAPGNAILNFTITGLEAGAKDVLLHIHHGFDYDVFGSVTPNASGVATFGIGVPVGANIKEGSNNLTVGSSNFTLPSSTTFAAGHIYNISRSVAAAPAGAEAVDLGLSVKWANMNVGATSEGDYGQFFAWGETTGYGSNTADGHKFGWPSYSLCGGSNTTLTKYNNDGNKGTVDNKTTLEAADDAATANWGGDWRMPTYDELNELLATKTNANYTWTWTTVGGHNGYKITNNTTGANIFLPASGGRYDTTLGSQGTYGNYWSSSLNVSNARYGHYLSFEPNSASMVYTFRHSGFSVRPVQGAAAPAGALSGEFSVSATKKVKFSQGNLRATYNGSSWTWSFATNQYDYIGNAEGNTKVSGSDPFVTGYTGSSTTVDLFGWSTSTTYLGINNSTNNNTYSGDSSNPGIFVDWGSHADVIAGIGSGWFTLSGAEWAYLFGMESKNKDKSGHARYRKYFRAQVNGVSGIVFLPDDISGISNIPAESSRGTASSFDGKTYTTDAWSALESAGCVFLPAAGGRNGSTVNNAGTLGCYWSATPYNAGQTYYVGIYSFTLYPGSTSYSTLEFGNSVRLVREVE